MKSTTSVLRYSSLAALVTLAGIAAAGCAAEDYYCDATGCFYCDGIGCRRVDPAPRPACRGDYECSAGAHCTTVGCVESCGATGAACPEGTTCRVETGECLGPTEPVPTPRPGTCSVTADCGDVTLVCRDGMCVHDSSPTPACDAAHPCASGSTCVSGECRLDTNICHHNSECGADRVCIDGACVAQCDAARPCPTGQACDAGGVCRDVPPTPGEMCSNDAACGAGRVCISGACVDSCTTDAMCGAGRYCSGGVCAVDDRPHPFCSSDADCMPGHPCSGGVCRTACSTTPDCARFDVTFNYCLDMLCVTTNEATSNCALSADCMTGQECIDGICR